MPPPSAPQPFNGINATTGDYGLTLSADQLVQRVFGDASDAELGERRDQYTDAVRSAQKSTMRGVRQGVDGTDLAQAGWGILFAYDDPQIEAIQEALQPLLQLRREQAGPYYRVFTGPDAYRPGESKVDFLRRFGVGAGAVDPKKGVPYYLLLIGGPELIPYPFQYQLDVQFAVGRLDFDDIDSFASYANSVAAAESGTLQLARSASFFSVVNPDDSATASTDRDLVRPLLAKVEPAQTDWTISALHGQEATRSNLEALLGGEEKPALLFTASHGIEFPAGDPRQIDHQGALLCADWPGPVAWRGRGPLPEDHYFAGDHLASTANPAGMVNFHFACFGGGTPQYNDLSGAAAGKAIADRPFVAHLPKRLLGHPRGGALAVVSHVDRAYSYSYRQDENSQTAVFEDTLTRLFMGQPLGWALEYFNMRYAELASVLSNELQQLRLGGGPAPLKLAALWTENNDARNYVILGDPAVRLAVAGQPGAAMILPDGRPVNVPAPAWQQTPIVVQNALTAALRQIEQLSDQLSQAEGTGTSATRRRTYRDGERRSATTRGATRGGATRGGTTRGGGSRGGRTDEGTPG